jgi:galactokinase/mevalonate kinase-like predicted kinase
VGGQYCRNDRKTIHEGVVNIAGMTPLPNRQGWSTSSEWVVSMIGTSGQYGSESPIKETEFRLSVEIERQALLAAGEV